MLPLFLARRFYHGRALQGAKKASSPAIRIATIGIAVGLAVMLVSLCIVTGYQQTVRGKLTGFVSHIEILDVNAPGSPESFPLVTDGRMTAVVKQAPGVVHVQRFAEKIGILKTADDFAGFNLKGLGPEYDTSLLRGSIVSGNLPDFSDAKSSGCIVISQTLADRLGLKVGDEVFSYFFARTIKQRRFKIAAIYNTHLKQVDRSFVFTDLYTVNRLNGWQPDQSSGYEVRLGSLDEIPTAQIWLQKHVGTQRDCYGRSYYVQSIYENPRTVSVMAWLGLLDFNLYVILVIMIVVAGFTMVSGLLILILERTTSIGLLKALGMSDGRLRRTFLWFAALIVVRGVVIGNVVGLGLAWLQSTFRIVPLNPEQYHIDYVPVAFSPLWIIGINVLTIVVTMLSLLVPSLLISRVEPARAIRFD